MRWPAGTGTLGGNATTPLVRLRINREGAHLAPNGRLVQLLARMFLLPSYDFTWSDIRQVERLTRGIRFTTAQMEDPIAFWTTDPNRMLDACASYTIAIDRQPQRVYGHPRLHRGPLTRRKAVGVVSAIVTAVFANILWTIVGLPAAVTILLRVLVLIICALYVLAVVLIPDNYWTRRC